MHYLMTEGLDMIKLITTVPRRRELRESYATRIYHCDVCRGRGYYSTLLFQFGKKVQCKACNGSGRVEQVECTVDFQDVEETPLPGSAFFLVSLHGVGGPIF
jgi:hypothetical protein